MPSFAGVAEILPELADISRLVEPVVGSSFGVGFAGVAHLHTFVV